MININVHELVIPIPPSLIDELARQVADKVAEQIGRRLWGERERSVETRLSDFLMRMPQFKI
jgi:hypothetical protein